MKKKIIVITPTRNESWIIDLFLKAASLWADHIIIADQNSDDGTSDIVRRCGKAILVRNASREFNEPQRQQLLIDEARKIPGKNVLVALDADELLSGNFRASGELSRFCSQPEGTVGYFQRANLRPGLADYWTAGRFPAAFVDDGTTGHRGEMIHSPRLPLPANHRRFDFDATSVMHFQYVDWARMASKHRWYQCYEILNRNLHPVEIFRIYHHMYGITPREICRVPDDWRAEYAENGIALDSFRIENRYWWDGEVLALFDRYGPGRFRSIDVWKTDWRAIAVGLGRPPVAGHQRWIDTLALAWLRATKWHHPRIATKLGDRLLALLWNR